MESAILTFDEAALLTREGCFDASNTDKLKLYGLFKVAQGAPPPSSASDGAVNAAKHRAWTLEWAECGGDARVAKQRYIAHVVHLTC